MAESSSASTPFPKTVEEIFREYCGRRNALIRALTEGTINSHLTFVISTLIQLHISLLSF